ACWVVISTSSGTTRNRSLAGSRWDDRLTGRRVRPVNRLLVRPFCVAARFEHLHCRECGVGEATEGVAAPLPGGKGGGPVAGQVEGVDERDVVEGHVARVVLLVI